MKLYQWLCKYYSGRPYDEEIKENLDRLRFYSWHDLKDKSVYISGDGDVKAEVDVRDGIYYVFAEYGHYRSRCEFGKYISLEKAKKRVEDLFHENATLGHI